MEKEFIPYEQALALKELGFNEPCFAVYNDPDFMPIRKLHGWENDELDNVINSIYSEGGFVTAPLYQQAFRWFREKHKLSGIPQYFTGGFYCYTINDMKDTKESNRLFTEFETYEQAQLECIKKLIEIVNNER